MPAALLTMALVALAIAVPVLAVGGGGVRRALLLGGALVLLAGAGATVLAGPAAGLAAALPAAGFAVALAGAARALLATRLPAAASAGAAALLGCGLLVLPFLGDPLVEARGPGRSSPAACAALLGGSPLTASVGGGLGVDLLRTPRAYGGPEGQGLSRIGAFYPRPYPGPLASGAGFAAAGVVLLLLSGLAHPRTGR